MPPLSDAKLTPALYEVFLSYKKATSQIERWLANTSNKNETKVRLTISELQKAADYIKKKRIKVPDTIYFAFDKANTARSEVTSHFKSFFTTKTAEQKNASHEHFTEILQSIFKSLCSDLSSFSKPKETRTLNSADLSDFEKETRTLSSAYLNSFEKETRASSLIELNPFETLSSLRIDDESPSTGDNEDIEADEEYHEHGADEEIDAKDEGIKDDAIVQDFELLFALWDLETVCAKVKDYWTKATVGTMPVMLAAFLTNAARANVASRFRCGSRFFDISEVIAYEEVFNKLDSKTTGILEGTGSSGSVVTSAFKVEMEAPFSAIISCQQGKFILQDNNQKPHEYVKRLEGPHNSIRRAQTELKFCELLLSNLTQLTLVREGDQSKFLTGFHPLIDMPDLQSYEGPIPTSATYVLRLMVEAYKSWYNRPGEETVPSCRLHALRFAHCVRKSVNRIRLSEPFEPKPGCNCSDCRDPGLMEHLRIFEEELSQFTSEKRWDLFHQSPVVAGYQMTRILARATHLGINFCNILQYVGVVLHLYNLLRQFDFIDEEAVLLESLCDAIGHNIFRAPRPTDGFFSKYAAFQKMTYRLDTKTKRHIFRDTKTRLSRMHPHSLSVMTGLNSCNFSRFCHRWGPVWRGIDKRSPISNNELQRTADQMAAHPLICMLEPLEAIVRPEWEGDFPVARINWFEVFTACTDILEKISAFHCSDPRELTTTHVHRNRDDSFACGLQEVGNLLAMAQQLDRPSFKVDCANNIRVAGNAIRDTLKGRKKAEFLWDL